jgi:hypothetical protein
MSNYAEGAPAVRARRANPMGAYVTVAGIALFTIAVFLDWLSADVGDAAQADGRSVSGYETDPLIPFVAYLGIGLAAALLYAMTRAYRRQHRGLTLASMAVGIAATLLALSYLIDAPGISENGGDLSPEVGVWLALRARPHRLASVAKITLERRGPDLQPIRPFPLQDRSCTRSRSAYFPRQRLASNTRCRRVPGRHRPPWAPRG